MTQPDNRIQPIAVGLETAASMIGLRPRTLRKFATEGRVVSSKLGGKLVFKVRELENFLDRNERSEK